MLCKILRPRSHVSVFAWKRKIFIRFSKFIRSHDWKRRLQMPLICIRTAELSRACDIVCKVHAHRWALPSQRYTRHVEYWCKRMRSELNSTSWRRRFRKVPFSGVHTRTREHENCVFKSFYFGKRFRWPFSSDTSGREAKTEKNFCVFWRKRLRVGGERVCTSALAGCVFNGLLNGQKRNLFSPTVHVLTQFCQQLSELYGNGNFCQAQTCLLSY